MVQMQKSKKLDLNAIFSIEDNKNDVDVYFTDITSSFIRCLQNLQPNAICGAMYHLSSSTILQHLAHMKIPTNFIIQKQNTWERKPKKNIGKNVVSSAWKQNKKVKLREMYDALTPMEGYESAVSCIGSCHKDNQSLMHHKFVIFMRHSPGDAKNMEPFALWNGSFNFSFNATQSLENAMLIQDEKIVQAFYKEWLKLQKFKEPLDWKKSKFEFFI
jgi:phosphatidylserine/phosphatidylglycerophosphate/cardiolipin synthase-like enzyme